MKIIDIIIKLIKDKFIKTEEKVEEKQFPKISSKYNLMEKKELKEKKEENKILEDNINNNNFIQKDKK